MCGIIGYKPYAPLEEHLSVDGLEAQFRRLLDESRIRGMHAYGIGQYFGAVVVQRSFDWEAVAETFTPGVPTIAHARYCQSGDYRVMENNQPIVVSNMALAMNGVIHMGTKEEFEAAFQVQCAVDNDSEIFLRKLEQGVPALEFIEGITGSFAAVWMDGDRLYAGRNARRPLWLCKSHGADWVASTRDIFLRAGFQDPVEIPPGVIEIGVPSA